MSGNYIRSKGVFDPIFNLQEIEAATTYHMQPEEVLAALGQHATLRAMAMFPIQPGYGVKVTGMEIHEDGRCAVYLHLVKKDTQ